ncbi:phytoene desaturase family protein [Leptospira brenneri]|uniref:NAD(P)/FAD-dependent oxidoreductase n=1 Tax=Leptospira brenneri TaxID=2023182 RepID=A0A2M9XZH1_9LEPT|nr:NAD(P)/FAD-dependent oxidoreductase [Leptospira brenneri]PJZ44689.1 phytoene dehydrogenase [Leptospira brenneri]TGK96927.1 NAD(P)/FAD-dependent oxidoreductase [Leptospira brenneri]
MAHYDTVVIGAGNAGLMAATRLQREGAKTLLLERHNVPGGCATSFVRGDFEFEVALHQLSGVGTESNPFIMRRVFEELGVLDKIELVQEKELYRIIMPGRLDVTLPADWQELKQHLKNLFSEEEDSIERFFALSEAVVNEYYFILPRVRLSGDEEKVRVKCPNFTAYGLRSTTDVLNEFFSNEDLINVITPYWSYVGIPTTDLVFAEFIGMLYFYCVYKPWHIKGGSQMLSSSLLESFEEAGGEVRFHCAAEKILTENGAVWGVRLETGETVTCDAVVSNASPLLTYHEMLDLETPPPSVLKDFQSRRMGVSAVCLYLGLDSTPEELGFTTASTFVMTTSNAEVTEDRMYSLEAPDWGMVTCYNFIDQELAPKGKAVVTLVALQYGEAWKDISPVKYFSTKYSFGEKLIDLVEQAYPKIRDHIEKAEVATPMTMMRYLNTPGGAIYGFKQTLQDGHLFRDSLDAIDGLYSASSWTSMGGFQPTYLNGYNTARKILKRSNIRRKSQKSSHTK